MYSFGNYKSGNYYIKHINKKEIYRYIVANELLLLFDLKKTSIIIKDELKINNMYDEINCCNSSDYVEIKIEWYNLSCILNELNIKKRYVCTKRNIMAIISMIAYDIFIGYNDRHSGNILIDNTGEIVLIDNSINYSKFVFCQNVKMIKMLGIKEKNFTDVIGLLLNINIEDVCSIINNNIPIKYEDKIKLNNFFRWKLKNVFRLVEHYKKSIYERDHITRIRSNKYYQSISLPDGEIKGNYNTEKEFYSYLSNLPSFKNKTVLDLGANIGVLSCLIKREGAKKVVCVEKYECYDNLVYLNNYYQWGLFIEKEDIIDYLSKCKKHDIVIMFSVIHWSKTPKLILSGIKNVAKKYIIIETLFYEDKRKAEIIEDNVKPFSRYPSIECFTRFFNNKFNLIKVIPSIKSENRKIMIFKINKKKEE